MTAWNRWCRRFALAGLIVAGAASPAAPNATDTSPLSGDAATVAKPRFSKPSLAKPSLAKPSLETADWSDLRPLQGRLEARPAVSWFAFLGFAVLFASASAAAAGVWWWRHRRHHRLAVALPTVHPDVELDRLWRSGLAQRDAPAFLIQLTAIVRRHLELRFEIPAMEQTTAEILDAAARHPDCSAEMLHTLERCLSAADLVKFAKHVPSREEMEEAMRRARQAVAFSLSTHPPHSSSLSAQDSGTKWKTEPRR